MIRTHAPTARVLLELGASTDAADHQRRTPRDLATERELSGMLDLFTQHAALGGSDTVQLRPGAAFESTSSQVDLELPSRAVAEHRASTTQEV